MAKSKTKCVDSESLLLEIDEALYALDQSQKKLKKLSKKNKKAIESLLRLEASIEDASPCNMDKPKKSKKKKSKKELAK